MKEYSAIVTLLEKGKITIPQQIRDVLGAEKGDYLEIKISKIETQIGESKGNGKTLCSA